MKPTPREPLAAQTVASEDGAVEDVIRAIAHAPPRPPPVDPQSGTSWGDKGRYVVERRLGRGGMGTVYLAADTLLGRHVALKVLDAGDNAEDQAQRARLMREARLAAGLEHERVARVYDVGEHDGSAFVAMEFVRGVTLRAWMGEPRSPEAIVSIVLQIAEGLAVLHVSGVVHRDLKPENVMLTASGDVKLLDFGLAGTLATETEGSVPVEVPRGVPSVSAFLGTPGYMAPEQYAGRRADARADVFALGVLVFELVTGDRPFHGATMAALARAIEQQPPRFDGPRWTRFPPPLATATARMLEVDPGKRHASGAEALDALRAAQPASSGRPATLEPAIASPPPRRSLPRGALGLGSFVVLASLVGMATPRVARELALRRALAKPAPPGMALVNEGALTVGQSAETVARQCADLGARCNPELMRDQIPALRATVAPYYLDTREVTNREMVAVLDNLSSSLFVVRDEDDHTLRHVRFNAGLGKPEEYLLDLHAAMGGIEYAPESGFRARAGREEWPVNQVTWFGARLFCATQGKRLPSENEWEAAARGAADRPFPWGFDPPRCGQVVVPGDGFLPMEASCPKTPSPVDVGTARQDVSPEGVRDLGGNVSEWTNTVFVDGDRGSVGAETNRDLPRVLRGGSFFFSLLARTSVRNRRPPDYLAFDLGFRCAADLGTDSSTPRKE